MMRFANHDLPLLLEVLGDLLAMKDAENPQDAKRLAARAYLKASYEVKDEQAKTAYRTMAADVLKMQRQRPGSEEAVTLKEVERAFEEELVDANVWYAELHRKENGWIKSGAEVEKEFDRLYKTEPDVESPEDLATGDNTCGTGQAMVTLATGIALFVGIFFGAVLLVGFLILLGLMWRHFRDNSQEIHEVTPRVRRTEQTPEGNPHVPTESGNADVRIQLPGSISDMRR
jgi:hypothetical protein